MKYEHVKFTGSMINVKCEYYFSLPTCAQLFITAENLGIPVGSIPINVGALRP